MKLNIAKPYINDKICNDVLSVLKSGNIVQGPKVKQLEEEFSKFSQVKYCAAVNSGTAALHAALYAIGIGPGDEVITTPFTFVATANSILMVGARPVFADVDERTFNIDPEDIERKITSKTKAIIPVHLFGQPAEMDKISDLAKHYNLKIVEDACQAHGAEFNNKRVGGLGDIAAFSLYATKNMMAGEGGLVTSNNKESIERVKSYRHHGQSLNEGYNYISFGYNYRMTDINAVIAINQLEKLEEFNIIRNRNALLYMKALKDINGIAIPFKSENCSHVYHQYTIKIDENQFGHSRNDLINELNRNDIFPGIFYPRPLHLFPTFETFGYKENDFPISERLSRLVLSLPVHPGISENDVQKVIDVISQFSKLC
ncbi:MAG: DegT/DnrJ/EryC1/StrS family aminotransferase [Bacteroidales bacterium]